mgnify:CR=1 FL=1
MATQIYKSGSIYLMDGTELYITPLKLKYMREFMDVFEAVKLSANDEQAISALAMCATVAMKQYYPSINRAICWY